MIRLPIHHVDAFASCQFAGNPAAVVPLEEWLPDDTMQKIAAENNLAETAFFVERDGRYRIRWFSPTTEIDLCGHATLGSAWVLMERMGYAEGSVEFDSLSGPLGVDRVGGMLWLDFPARPAAEAPDGAVGAAVGGRIVESLASKRDRMLVYESAEDVIALQPDFAALTKTGVFAAIATAPGGGRDYVYRFFAPSQGIPEDPATGSAQCALMPYWAEKLGRSTLQSRQVSMRGGEFSCELKGDRVRIGGQVFPYLEGTISVD
jgi:predicted PhzF superfamily epimerase YddE/YHI9